MAEYKIPRFTYKPITEEMLLKMDYKSPVEVIRHEMQMRVENDVMKAVQQHDIYVDKNELIKALKYDRDQYVKGFADGCRDRFDRLIEQVKTATVKRMQVLLHKKANYKVCGYYCVSTDDIDEIAKKVIGGADGQL